MAPPLKPLALNTKAFQDLLSTCANAADDKKKLSHRKDALSPHMPSKPSSARPGWLSERRIYGSTRSAGGGAIGQGWEAAGLLGEGRPHTARERRSSRHAVDRGAAAGRPVSSPGKRFPSLGGGGGMVMRGGDGRGSGGASSPRSGRLSGDSSPSASCIDVDASNYAYAGSIGEGLAAAPSSSSSGWDEELESLSSSLATCASSLDLNETVRALEAAATDALRCQFVTIFLAYLDEGIIVRAGGGAGSRYSSQRGIAGSACRSLGGDLAGRNGSSAASTSASASAVGPHIIDGVLDIADVRSHEEYDPEIDDVVVRHHGGAADAVGSRPSTGRSSARRSERDKDGDVDYSSVSTRNLVSGVAKDAKGVVNAVVQAANKLGGFTRRDRKMLGLICRHVGPLVALCQDAAARSQRTTEEALQRKFGQRILTCVTPDSIGALLCEYGRSCLDVSQVYFVPFGKVRGRQIGPMGLRGCGIVERVAATNEAIVVPDIDVEHQYKQILDIAPECASLIAVPLQHNGERCLGTIVAISEMRNRFSRGDTARISVLFPTFCAALERIILMESSLELQEKLPSIFAKRDTNSTLRTIEQTASELLNATSCRIHVHNVANGKVWHITDGNKRVELHATKGFVADVLKTGKPLACRDALSDPQFNKSVDVPSHMTQWHDAVPVLVLPIMVDGGSQAVFDPLEARQAKSYGLPGSFKAMGSSKSWRESGSMRGSWKQRGPMAAETMKQKNKNGGVDSASLEGASPRKGHGALFKHATGEKAPILSGVMVVARSKKEDFSESDREMAVMLSQAIAVALESCLRHEMSDLVLSDSEAMLKTAYELCKQTDMQDIIQEMHRAASSHTKASACSIYLSADSHPNLSKMTCHTTIDGEFTSELVPIATSTVLTASISLRCVINSDSVETFLGLLKHHGKDGARGRLHHASALQHSAGYTRDNFEPEMAVPMFNRAGGILGAVIVRRSKGTEGFSDAEEAQLDYMTAVASANLVRAFERKALELERGRLKGKVQGFQEGVKDTCRLANPEPDDTTIADDFLSICKTKVPCTHASMLWVAETQVDDMVDGGLGMVIGASFETRNLVGKEWVSHEVAVDRGIALSVLQTGAPITVNSVEDEINSGDFEPETDSLPGDKNVKNPNNLLAVPVWAAGEGEGIMGRILGVLMLFNRLTGQHELQHHFSEGDVNFAQSLSRVLSLQLQNATMFSSMNDSIHSIRKLLASETNVWQVVEESAVAATKCSHFTYMARKAQERGEEDDRLSFTVKFPFEISGDKCTSHKGAVRDCIELGSVMCITSDDARVTPSAVDSAENQGADSRGKIDNDGFEFLIGHEETRHYAHHVNGDGHDDDDDDDDDDDGAGNRGKARRGGRVWWQSALMCPVSDEAGAITGCVVLLNAARGFFTQSDVAVVVSLCAAARSKIILTDKQRMVASVAEVRQGMVKAMCEIVKSVGRGVPSIARVCLDNSLRLTSSKFAALYLNNIGDKAGFVCYSSDGSEPKAENRKDVQFVSSVWVSQATTYINDADPVQSSAVPRSLRGQGPCRMLAAPIKHEARLIGVLVVAVRSDEYGVADEAAVNEISQVLASCLKGGGYVKAEA